MKNKLERYIRDHRSEFDDLEPDGKIWASIETKLGPSTESSPKRTASPLYRMLAAAAVLLLIASAAGVWLYEHKKNEAGTTLASTQSSNEIRIIDTAYSERNIDPELADINKNYAREAFHYASLIELKREDIERIKTRNPALYKDFAQDFASLDSNYKALKNQLPKTGNPEILLKAMIHNLQLQIGLLNQQLDIISKINSRKNQITNESIHI